LSQQWRPPPRRSSCCAYAERFDRNYPCFHGAAAIVGKHGAPRLHLFIAKWNLTSTWKAQCCNATFAMPSTADVASVLEVACRSVATGTATNAPVALPAPRGRPVKDAGTRRKSWNEQGPGATRRVRSYTCNGTCACLQFSTEIAVPYFFVVNPVI
jgi:hypothetical protein